MLLKLFYYLRKGLKKILARHFLVIEYCHDCGARQRLVWTADNSLWSMVAAEPFAENMAGVLCPVCFDKRAFELGIFTRWKPVVERHSEHDAPKLVNVVSWEFDNHGTRPDRGTVCYGEREDAPENRVTVDVPGGKPLSITAFRDQWGTFISFEIEGQGFTVCQEDETRSFMDALLASLEKLKAITDIGTLPATMHTVAQDA